jgi:hypothetical protein
MTIAYTTGQITLTNGSAVVTGVGTAWSTSLIAGGIIAAEAGGNLLPIESVVSDTSITAAIEWKGATGTYDYALVRDTAYLQQLSINSNTLARLIAELDAGTIFKYDASGDLAGRATYDERGKGFSYLVFIGVSEPALYVKASATSGDWDGPYAYGTGPVGPVGPAGYVNFRGAYSGATAYAKNDGVLYNGSSFVALQTTTGNAPPTLPTPANAYWQLLAVKGADGTGTGDLVGPTGAVDGNIAVFDGTTGKLVRQMNQAQLKTFLGPLDGKNDALLALEIADLKGQRMGMVGGIADSFDDTTGITDGTLGGIDPAAYTVLHFDGTNNSVVFTDSGSRARLWQPAADVKISTAQSKFGGASAFFDGAGDYLGTFDNMTDFTFGTGDFTIDFQFRPIAISATASTILCELRATSATNNPVFYISVTGKASYVSNGGVQITGTTTLVAGQFYHLALSRVSGVTRLFVNGVQEGISYADANNYAAPVGVYIGSDYTGASQVLNGYVDEFRISKAGRYAANFTPPSTAYSLDPNGSLNYVYDAANDWFLPYSNPGALNGNNVVSGSASWPSAAYTCINRDFKITNGVTVQKLGVYSTLAFTGKLKILNEDSTTQYDVLLDVAITHPGTGWYDITLVTPYVIPDTGTFRVGVYASAAPAASNAALGAFAFKAGDITGNDQSGFTVASSVGIFPMRFSSGATGFQNMTLISVAYAAASVPGTARIALQLANSVTLVPNTDFSVDVSRDGGTTWTAVTLALTVDYGGVKMYEGVVSISAQPSGSSMKWRAKSLTNKNVVMSGVVLQQS